VSDATQLIAFLSGGEVADPEWPKLVQAAGETLTIGLLADRALGGEWKLPDAIHDLLTEVRDRARTRNARTRDQFAELLGPLNEIGVEPIPMKGLARLLGSATNDCRLLSDIDILVPTGSRNDCISAMQMLGYAPVEEEDGRAPIVLSRSRDVGSVDLHAQLNPFYLQLGYKELGRLSERRNVAGGTALVPTPTCEALMLIAHDQLHDADYWRGLVDVRHLLDLQALTEEGIDWPKLSAVFADGTCRRALEVGLRTASSFTGADVPRAYRGGRWAKLQVGRRRLQARFPALQPLLTLLTIAADAPPISRSKEIRAGWRGTLRRRWSTYLRPGNPGKSGARSVREAVDVR
jgi:hypothetical protein